MARQSFMWTTLPNGLTPDGAGLRVSVMLSPRLDTLGDPPRLDSFFPDWQDWPATLAAATFRVHYNGGVATTPAGAVAGPSRVDPSLGLPDSDVWNALFHAATFVRPFQFKDLSGHGVLSYDTTAVAGLVQGLYGALGGQASGRMPLASDLLENGPWQQLIGDIAEHDRRFFNAETGVRDVDGQFNHFRNTPLDAAQSPAQALLRLQLFHTPLARPAPVTKARTDDGRISATWMQFARSDMPTTDKPAERQAYAADAVEQIDFHQIVAAMNSYPTLLRRLGLVIDLILDRHVFGDVLDAALWTDVEFAPGALQVPRAKRDVSPQTHARLTDRVFAAVSNPAPAPHGFRVVDGLLDLDPHRFAVLQADVDGAGLKLLNFVRTLGAMVPGDNRVDPVTRFEKEIGAPALRTAGMMLVHRGRGAMLEERFGENKDLDDMAQDVFDDKPGAVNPSVWAEDLVRGFRFDIWDAATGVWRSLCRREAVYDMNDGAVVVGPEAGEEEGIVRLGATKSPDPASHPDIICLHEALVSWTGWSLAAPQPGRAITPDDQVDTTAASTEAELPPGMTFRSRFKAVKGSLPRLRFGRRYWMRGRAVDLAGNSRPPIEQDFGPEKPQDNAGPFLRYEPVAAPIVALVKREDGTTESPAEGESMLRIAVRSFNDTPPDNAIPTTQVARRFAVPPQSSAKDAELHGRLDVGGAVSSATFSLLATLRDRDAKDPAAALVEETIAMPAPQGGPPEDVVFGVYRDGHGLTYLPDPLAGSVSARIFGHPGIPDTEIIPIPLYPAGAWPDAQPFKVEVLEEPGGVPRFDEADRTLRVPLAKGDRATVRLSMRLRRRDLHDVMGVWSWLAEADRRRLEGMAIEGQHWMLTPWRSIEVVHAVQRPLIAPEISTMQIQRGGNDTAAFPAFVATCSLKSTDRVDLMAEWHEPSDDSTAPASETQQIDRARGDVAFSVKISEASAYALKLNGHPRGGFAEHTIEAPDLIGVGGAKHDFVLPRRHEFRDTRYRRIEYWLEGTTKFREHMPSTVLMELVNGTLTPSEKNIKVVGPRRVTWIPSSAPPPTPEVLYVVPTFGWSRSVGQSGASSWRRGGGLRVYLGRPWNATGYGEMLAVVLPPASFTGNPDLEPVGHPYKKYVTQWGNDPIWQSPFVAGIAPRRESFPLARSSPDTTGAWLPKDAPPAEADQRHEPFTVTGLRPPDAPFLPGGAGLVDIAPHDVFYDVDRRLWYCDIEVDQGASYWPFIRLALARYQPTSIGGAHLSSVVLADFMPLTADRWLNMKLGDDGRTRHVSVFGNTYDDSSSHQEAIHSPSMSVIDPITHTVRSLTPATVAPSSVVEVWVERLDPAKGEDFGWERLSTAVIRPSNPPGSSPGIDPGAIRSGLVQARALRRFTPAAQIVQAMEFQKVRDYDSIVAQRLIDKLYVFAPLWDGDVALPENIPPGARHRLVIAEYEEYLIDDDRPYDKVPTAKGRRMVFVEHIELT